MSGKDPRCKTHHQSYRSSPPSFSLSYLLSFHIGLVPSFIFIKFIKLVKQFLFTTTSVTCPFLQFSCFWLHSFLTQIYEYIIYTPSCYKFMYCIPFFHMSQSTYNLIHAINFIYLNHTWHVNYFFYFCASMIFYLHHYCLHDGLNSLVKIFCLFCISRFTHFTSVSSS